MLSEEKRVVDLVRHGMGKHEKIGLDQAWAIRREWLSAEQKTAVFHLLNSPDFGKHEQGQVRCLFARLTLDSALAGGGKP